MEMERLKPGSFEVLMSRMLQRLARSTSYLYLIFILDVIYLVNIPLVQNSELEVSCSSKESSLKDLQDLATHVFTKGKTVTEQTSKVNADTDSRKKLQNKEANQNSNLSPLARFLLSRFVY